MPELLDFPCHFPIKIVGSNTDSFISDAMLVVHKHFSKGDEVNMKTTASKNNNYIALTVTVYAKTQASLDALYQDLCKIHDVKMVL